MFNIQDNGSFLNRMVVHDVVNYSFRNKIMPHEWLFINFLFKSEIRRNPDVAMQFMMFTAQYHPEYLWTTFNLNDPVGTVVVECALHDMTFRMINMVEVPDDRMKKAMSFGDIVTEFLIRFLNYSLIKCSGNNVIITAQSDCDKRFESQLSEGYSLHRLAKLGYIKLDEDIKALYPEIDGYFYRLPVLPTKDIGYKIDEAIEDDNFRLLKVL